MSSRKNQPRLRDLPFLPFLWTLHILFITSSLILRVYELLTQPADVPTVLNRYPPKHVGVVLSPNGHRALGHGKTKKDRDMERAAVESIKRITRWARESGVEVVSFYDGQGIIQGQIPKIKVSLNRLSSTSSSPVSTRSHSATSSAQSSPQRSLTLHQSQGTPSIGEWEVISWAVKSPRKRHTGFQEEEEDSDSDSTARESDLDSASPSSSPSKYHRKKSIKVVMIPPAGDFIPSITRDLISEGVPPGKITQQVINSRVEEAMQCPPPDLLLIHPLSPLSFWRNLLPRAPPELGGYPFWSLRITEIYQHPPALPISPFQPLLSMARRSKLPLIRKIGNLLPPTEEEDENGDSDQDDNRRWIRSRGSRMVEGIVDRDEWDGAMKAWSQVEQRLGR